MTSGAKRYRVGYRAPNGSWVVGPAEAENAVVGYYDPASDTWHEGVADIQSGQWLPEDSVLGTGERDCPAGYPVKGNLPSRIYHAPGQPTYGRTNPEVCFATEAAAQNAGFRHSSGGAVRNAAAAAPVVATVPLEAQRVDAPSTPTPPPPPPPTAPPPAPEPRRNWLWLLLAALVALALIWWFLGRNNDPAPVVAPEATVAAPADATAAPEETEEAEETPDVVGIVASPVTASPVADPVGVVASPVAGMASPVAGADVATPLASPVTTADMAATPIGVASDAAATPAADVAEASPAVATAVAEAVATAEAALEATP